MVELTKEQYENYRSIKPGGGGGEHDQDVPASVGANPAQEAKAPVPRKGFKANPDGKGTKAEITETLQRRGLRADELKGLKRQELIDLL